MKISMLQSFGFSAGLLALAATAGCKMITEKADLSGTVNNTEFAVLCKNFQLSKCDAKPSDAKVGQREWELGVDIFREILASPTALNISRSELDVPSVKNIFNTFGAQDLMSFIKRIPWSSLATQGEAIVLTSPNASQSVKANGLTLISEAKVLLKPNRSRSFTITGLSIADAAGKNVQKVLTLDATTAGRFHITTEKQRIVNFPVSFFALDGVVSKVDLSVSTVMKTITNLALDPTFDWRKKATIILNNANLVKLLDISNEMVPDSSPFGKTFETVVRKSKSIILGGEGNMLLAASLNAPVNCKMTFVNIPLLGTKNFDLVFSPNFGVNNLQKTSSGSALAKVYGITAGNLKLENAEIAGAVIKLKLGPLTIPLDMEKQVDGKGVMLKDMNCQ
jgi:hypothetical protein